MSPENSEPTRPREIRILALDVGEKRIGLAVSDPLGITAQGLGVLIRQNRESDLARLMEVGREYGVQEIVVGLPRHLDGRESKQTPAIMNLAQALGDALGVVVTPWDERLTTVEAERVLLQADLSRRRRRQVVDQVAAVLILQSYLEYRHLSK
ncbi:MAG: Holliday junction resolvase RuvX [Syntrophales bacterium]|nr:Holliday junction resolvase RuvX [Syntrophales bacterium]MDD5642016.1 Holliday junction resolvase RuvX [Syntrophales bacterium]